MLLLFKQLTDTGILPVWILDCSVMVYDRLMVSFALLKLTETSNFCTIDIV